MTSGTPDPNAPSQNTKPDQTSTDDDAAHVEEVAEERIQEEIDDNRNAAR